MKADRAQVLETTKFLKKYIDGVQTIGFLTGTGLSDSLNGLDIICELNYSDIPNFPISTVESHQSKLIFGTLGGKKILMMQGRFHLYEGYAPTQVVFPIRVMQEMGIGTLILSNAAGGINSSYKAGDIMIISDHINLTGKNPLLGPNEDTWGIRFPDMAAVYDSSLIDSALKVAEENQIKVLTGVYAGLLGPSLETPAEIRFLKTIGSDAVGLSTIMEAIAGVHAGMRILGISLITNINNPDSLSKTTIEEVLKVAQNSIKPLNRLICKVIEQI